MQNTYQDLITAVQNKNPAISPKLEGGKKFQMKTDFKPAATHNTQQLLCLLTLKAFQSQEP